MAVVCPCGCGKRVRLTRRGYAARYETMGAAMDAARAVAGDVLDGPLPDPLAEELALAHRVYDSVRTQLLAHVHGEARPGSHDDGATLNKVSSALLTALPGLAARAASHDRARRREEAPAASYVGSYREMGTQEILLGTTASGAIRVALGNVRHRRVPVPTTSLVVSAAAGLLAGLDGDHADAVIGQLRGCLDGVELAADDVALLNHHDVEVVRDRIVDRVAGEVIVETGNGPEPGGPTDPGGDYVFGSVLDADGNYARSLADWADIELDEVPASAAGRYIGAVWVAALSKTTEQRPPLPPLKLTHLPTDPDELGSHATTFAYLTLEPVLWCQNLRALAAFCDTFHPGLSPREHLAGLYPLVQPAAADLTEGFDAARRS